MVEKIKILETELEKATDYREKIELLYQLSVIYKGIDIHQALSYSVEASVLAKGNNDLIEYARHRILYVEICLGQGNYEELFEILEEVDVILEKQTNIELIYRVTFCRASIYKNLFYYEKSYKLFSESLEIAEKLDNKKMQKKSLGGLAAVFYGLKEFDKAIVYCSKGLEVVETRELEASLHNNIASCYFEIRSYEKALKHLLVALKIKRDLNQHLAVTTTLINLIDVCIATHQLSEAEAYLTELIQIAKVINTVKTNLRTAEKVIRLTIAKDPSRLPFSELEEMLKLAKNFDDKETLKIVFKATYDVYKMSGNFERALYYFEELKKIEEQAKIAETKSKIEGTKLLSQIEIIKKDAEIEHLKNVEIKNAYEEIQASLRYAKRIQIASLSTLTEFKSPFYNGFRGFSPKDIVSGDFYFGFVNDQVSFIAVADCTGHGVPGALLSMLGSSLLRQIIFLNDDSTCGFYLDELHRQIRNVLQQQDPNSPSDGMDIALIKIDFNKMKLEYAGANRPLLGIKKGELFEIKPDKFSIGGIYSSHDLNFKNNIVEIEPLDRFYIYSDGVTDQFGGEKNKKFGSVRLKDFFLNTIKDEGGISSQGTKLFNLLNAWMGNNSQTDDITMIGFEIR